MNELNDEKLQQVSGGLNDPEKPMYKMGNSYVAFNNGSLCIVNVMKFLGNINGNNMYGVSYYIQIKGSSGKSTPMYTEVTEKQIQDREFLYSKKGIRIL